MEADAQGVCGGAGAAAATAATAAIAAPAPVVVIFCWGEGAWEQASTQLTRDKGRKCWHRRAGS